MYSRAGGLPRLEIVARRIAIEGEFAELSREQVALRGSGKPQGDIDISPGKAEILSADDQLQIKSRMGPTQFRREQAQRASADQIGRRDPHRSRDLRHDARPWPARPEGPVPPSRRPGPRSAPRRWSGYNGQPAARRADCPKLASRAAIRRATVACVTPSARAAADRLPCRASSTRNWRSVQSGKVVRFRSVIEIRCMIVECFSTV